MAKSREDVTTNGRAVFYAALWNDFRQAALDKGWALGLHGSMASDLDIMAMPWVEKASSADEMIKALEGCLTEPDKGLWMPTQKNTGKPNSRVVYTICIFADFYLDVNIIEPSEKPLQLLEERYLRALQAIIATKSIGNAIARYALNKPILADFNYPIPDTIKQYIDGDIDQFP